jgi:hypothetical protein
MWHHGASAKSDPFQALVSSIGNDVPTDIWAGFAYASLRGAVRLRDAIVANPHLKGCRKHVCIGLHHGITEPAALTLLRDMENTKLDLFVPGKSLTASSLVSKPLYHPKFCFVKCLSKTDYWMIGSANLTAAAISPAGTNVEICSIDAKSGPAKARYRLSFAEMMNALKPHLRSADPSIISRYAKIRSAFLLQNRIILDQIEEPAGISLSKEFFVEVGAGSGMDRHQVEFNRELAGFFTKPQKKRVDFTLARGNHVWTNRPLTPKKTSFGVDIFRLGMPTIKSGGEAIAHRAIKFSRTPDPQRFVFDVDDIGGSKYNQWFSDCNKHGHVGQTAGGRVYGYVF